MQSKRSPPSQHEAGRRGSTSTVGAPVADMPRPAFHSSFRQACPGRRLQHHVECIRSVSRPKTSRRHPSKPPPASSCPPPHKLKTVHPRLFPPHNRSQCGSNIPRTLSTTDDWLAPMATQSPPRCPSGNCPTPLPPGQQPARRSAAAHAESPLPYHAPLTVRRHQQHKDAVLPPTRDERQRLYQRDAAVPPAGCPPAPPASRPRRTNTQTHGLPPSPPPPQPAGASNR